MGKVAEACGRRRCGRSPRCALVLSACAELSVDLRRRRGGRRLGNLDDFTFASMDVDYTLGRTDEGKSTLEVVERFVAVFPEYDQNHGMRRSIPDSYLGVPLNPRFVSITDGDGNPRAAEVDREDGTFTMTSRADDFVHGEQTYVFTYTLENVTRSFEDTGVDEFYWDVNGTEWAQPFGRVDRDPARRRATSRRADRGARLLSRLRGRRRACARSTRRMPRRADDVVAAADAIQPYQTMTIAVGLRGGHVRRVRRLLPRIAVGVAAEPRRPSSCSVGLGWGFATRARRLRDEPGRPHDHRRVHAARADRRAGERGAARPAREGDPRRGARAGGRRQHPHRRGRAALVRRRRAAGPAHRPVPRGR